MIAILADAIGFNALDITIVVAGITAMFVVAYLAGRVERGTRDFFLGGRGIPAWAVCLSFIATEISAATIVTVPAAAYRENWQYLQMFIGSALARVTIAFLFIPVFYKFDCTTIYEFLRHRFGPATHYAASIFFFITRLLASAVRLFVAAMGTAVILGWSIEGEDSRTGIIAAIMVFSLVGIVFIAYGGIKAVVWTNVLQALVFIGGGAATVIYLFGRIDGGMDAVIETAGAAGRLSVLNLSSHWTDGTMMLAMALNGYLVSLTVFGTDHDLMQRLLTVKTRQASQRSMLATIFVALPTVTLFLCIGTLLFVFYQQNPHLPRPIDDQDRVLPNFVATVMPHGLRGLLLLTILMASIDSPLGSLSASFVTDIYRPLIRSDADERHYLWVSRVSVVVFGVVLALLAYLAIFARARLWVAFQILGVTGGSLLGAFLLGLLTKRQGDRGNAIAMVCSAGTMAGLLALISTGRISLGWTWLILIGTAMTFVMAWMLGYKDGPPRRGFPVILDDDGD